MLVNMLLAANHRAPQACAVSDGVRTLTYKQMTLLASVFKDVVAKETQCERVGIILPASTAFPPALFGVLWSSKIAIPLNSGRGILPDFTFDSPTEIFLEFREILIFSCAEGDDLEVGSGFPE